MFLIKLIIIQVIMFGAVIYMLKKMMYGDTESAVSRLDKSYKETAQKKQEVADKIVGASASVVLRAISTDTVAVPSITAL